MAFISRNLPVHPIPSLRYGLNDMQASDEINDMEIVDCENFSVDEDSVVSSPGYIQWDNSVNTGPYYGIYQFKKSDGTQKLIRQKGSQLQYDSDNTGTWVNCTHPTAGSPAAAIALDTTNLPTFATLNDTVIYANGVQRWTSTDGITWSASTAFPVSKIVFNNGKNRLLYMGQPASPFRLDWSDINTPLTINASAWALVNPNNGEKIVGAGLTPQGTNLVFTEGSVYEVSDYVDDGIIDINFIGNTRLASHHSIVTTEDSVVWLGHDGFYELIGGTIRKISGRIKFTGRNNITKPWLVVGSYYNGKVHMSMPDSDISNDYNAQEYVINKHLPRPDSEQPYVITRNRRYWGCYGVEIYETASDKNVTLYAGDSRTPSGSPASGGEIFAVVNDYRDQDVTQGLNGSSQTAYLITKYFTENESYYVKRFKKFFSSIRATNSCTVTLAYRFLPYGPWTETAYTLEPSGEIEWDYGNGESGVFSEGYGFAQETVENIFNAIENAEKPRGIQFKIGATSINDVQFLNFAYSYIPKGKFK